MTAPASRTRLLVIDGIRLHRENLVASLAREASVTDVLGAADGREALRVLAEQAFTVVLLSMTTAECGTACREIVASAEPARVIAYGVSADGDEVLACARAGVAGYLLRDESYTDLMPAVETAVRGEVRCPPPVAAVLMRRMGPHGAAPELPGGADRLTAREREILGLIDDGMSNQQIARTLHIEVRTVKNHVHNLLEKLHVHRRGEAAAVLRGHPGTFAPTPTASWYRRDQVRPGPFLNT
jgi:DNA-binding NarL/FixJ family response regulator